MAIPITRRQQDALTAIIAHKAANDGCAPSVRELTHALGLATTSATYALMRSLVAAGRISVDLGQTRSIRVIGATWTPPQSP